MPEPLKEIDYKAQAKRLEDTCCDEGYDNEENFVDRVKEITGGRGVPVVYDSVGKDTFFYNWLKVHYSISQRRCSI